MPSGGEQTSVLVKYSGARARCSDIDADEGLLHCNPVSDQRQFTSTYNHRQRGQHTSDSPSRQVRMFREVFLIAELLDSKAESDDVGLERSWLGCPVRSSGLSDLLMSSKKPPLIHQTEARLIRRYSGYLGRGRTHAAKAH